MNNNSTGGVIVPLFKTHADLIRDHRQIQQQFEQEWEQAYRVWDAAKAAIEIREDELSKSRSSRPAAGADAEAAVYDLSKMSAAARPAFEALIKAGSELQDMIDAAEADMAAIRFDHEIIRARQDADLQLAANLKAAIRKRDDAFFGVGENARRSARFARVHSRRYQGPAATVTSIGVKQ